MTLPAWGQGKDEETIRNATTVLQAMVASNSVPVSVLAKADCIIILPSVKKFAVGIGGSGGRGPMTCRQGSDFSGKWSPPVMYTIGGASAGFQVGGSASDATDSAGFFTMVGVPTMIGAAHARAAQASERCNSPDTKSGASSPFS